LGPEQVKQSFDKSFRELTKKVKLPGFRPGKAPRAMLEPMINPEDWHEEAARTLVMSTLNQAIKEQGINADGSTQPSVEVKSLEKEAGTAEYVAKVPLPPQVELANYDGLSVVHAPVDVADEEIDQQIEEMRRRRSQRSTVTDRAVAVGDIAVVNIKPDDAAEGKPFMVSVGKSFPALDELVTGMHLEELKHAELTFPAEFSDKEWAGQTKSVTLTVNSLTAVKLPDLDDAFAKSLETQNVDELRERVAAGLRLYKEDAAFEVATDELLDAMVARSTILVSDNMWEQLADRRIRETAEEQARQGVRLEDYAKSQGMSLEQFVELWQGRAQSEIKRAFVIQNVFARENLRITNGDMTEELVKMAAQFGTTPDELYASLEKNDNMQELQFRAIQRKVRQFLLSRAEVKEEVAKVAPTEAPKKRASKKKAADETAVAPAEPDSE
jgi:trigger factor